MKRTHRLAAVVLLGTAIAAGPVAAFAADDAESQPAVTVSDLPTAVNDEASSCKDDDSAERAAQRDAALAKLGERLTAEAAQMKDGDRVLNRSGANYGSR
jgi:hypothetical protein